MLSVSDSYKEKMEELTRPNLYNKITFSFENVEAKADAEIDYNNTTFTKTKGDYTIDPVLIGTLPTKSITTFEKNRYTTNTNSVFKINDYEYIDNLTSNELSNDDGTFDINPIIKLDFDIPQYISALSLTFDIFSDITPEIFILHFNEEQLLIENNKLIYYSIDNLDFKDVNTIKLEIVKLNKGKNRARVNAIIFGVDKIFTNNDISSSGITYDRSADLISNEISSTELNFELLNLNDIYNPLNPTGTWVRFLKNQKIILEFGREINGEIEWLKVDTLYYDGLASVEELGIKIKAYDILNTLTGSVSFPATSNGNGFTAKELIQNLISQVQNSFPYEIQVVYDEVLDEGNFIYGFDTLDIKEALQLIANAHKCSLYSDEEGRIVFKNATDPIITITDNGHMSFSDINAAFNDTVLPTKSYVQFLKDFYNVEKDELIILPSKLTDDDKFGFVSDKICNDNCVFEENPMITITYSLISSIYEIPIVFDSVLGNYATDFRVTFYENDTLIDEFIVNNNDSVKYTIFNNVERMNKYIIEIIKWNEPNRRCVIDSISNGRVNDFYLSLDKLYSYPKLENLTNISKIRCYYYEDVISEDISVEEMKLENSEYYSDSNITVNNFKLSHSALTNKGYRTERYPEDVYEDVNFGLVDRTYIELTTSNNENKMFLKGNAISQKEEYTEVTYSVNGDIQDYKNPLIYGLEKAVDMSNWLYDYVLKGNTITLEYRGNPEVQPLDIIYVDTKFEEKLICRVISNSITVTGSMKGEMKVIKL